ncbi:DNA repair protein RecN (Recombination protein N) [Oribacterium sinus]|uniref:DNA repair protein RecN n=1 Tax=Oribacterium sinus TaxID=237576 RepID=A0A7W9W176_9FIRM|nr:DNA repair protein RecN [Oribacterium sinus]MBB6040565.1 DNA repair protein RecN (Recombination protein N) [Oribacterium sinus]
MLDRLLVKDLALIEKSVVEFSGGLNVLTGETGAGKSILLGSIQLALGQKANKDLIRHGKEQAIVELDFSLTEEEVRRIQALEEDLELEEERLLIRRKISEKKSDIRVNDLGLTLAKLREITGGLLDLHGQHEHQSLLREGSHLEIIDGFRKKQGGKLLEEVADAYHLLQEKKRALQKFSLKEEERTRELDFLDFEIQELADAHLSAGEEAELTKEYSLYENMDRLKSLLLSAKESLEEMDFHRPIQAVEEAKDFDESLKGLSDSLYDLEAVGEDCLRSLDHYLDHAEVDEEKLFTLGERLEQIRRVMMKHGGTEAKALAALAKKEERRTFLLDYEKDEEKAKKAIVEQEKLLREKAVLLSKERQEDAKVLAKQIQGEMQEMGFLDTKFEFHFQEKKEPTEKGLDEVEAYVSLNPGEPLRPLREVGSGGEISRIMLSIKTVLADTEGVSTLIFDEIDSGISGRTAEKVGEKLQKIAKNHQVILITHLPQIAAKADHHFLIEKTVENGVTHTGIHPLTEKESIEELARLLGGDELSEASLENARELKTKSKAKKAKASNA